MNLKKIAAITVAAASLAVGLSACDVNDASVAEQNIKTASENYEIPRRIVFFNGITDKYLLEIQGKCSTGNDGQQLTVSCKTKDGVKLHRLGLSDNVSYFVEQLDAANVSTDHYRVVFKPSVILPDIDLR
ncbi:hypothetical protein PBI_MRMAGOO_48 [Mycobacterium phage MrMagoo]|uniref:Lipoprotein n=1 Tax=Mycobacterium phage MrMagoo TaxID=1927020 RepID=A0A1L6BYH5_9CAUD|nr:site-specific recombination directionality factor RDF [Mycobacterium phage MrMagoo]APQ42152.1 hypothetical protein PBI_MRMAGOO_48 [Mycobacterium phage MrMagoo]ARM70228.1 hypothetical protein SEA_GARDENSALSA_48 [Mycobacterium phage GardenSalsa]